MIDLIRVIDLIDQTANFVAPLQKLVLVLHEVAAFALLRLERLVDDGEALVILQVLVAAVAVAEKWGNY